MTATAHPLEWPDGYPRTERRKRAPFNTGFAKARDGIVDELRRMNASNVVISTNIPTKANGLPYANQRTPDDPGVAVYFYWQGTQHALACDRWDRVVDNLQALRKSIEAMRGLDRWGASGILERAFSGFARLDAPGEDWSDVLGVAPNATYGVVRDAYLQRRRDTHPDRPGGDADEFQAVQRAWEQAQAELSGGGR